jgi:hypothetical protein
MNARIVRCYTAFAGAACVSLGALAQVATAPRTAVPITAPAFKPSIPTPPILVALTYAVPGQNPPSASASFPAVSYSISPPSSSGVTDAGGVGQRAATVSYIEVVVAANAGFPAALRPPAALTSLTISEHKPGQTATVTMSFAQPYLASMTYSGANAYGGVPQERLQFSYAKVTTTNTP